MTNVFKQNPVLLFSEEWSFIMDDTALKVAIAGFMHDIGKFADKDVFNISEQFLIDNADLYQPHYKGNYTHRHDVYTAAFIDHIEKLLPRKFIKKRRCHAWSLYTHYPLTTSDRRKGSEKPETAERSTNVSP